MHKLISSCFGIGYLKGGGSYAALVYTVIWYLAKAGDLNKVVQTAVLLLVFTVGVWSADSVEKDWGKDSSKVVIDEVAGMCLTLLFVPVTWKYALTGFVLFRFFDIAKPLFIKKLEYLPGGWGVMLDDTAAGFYARLVISLTFACRLF